MTLLSQKTIDLLIGCCLVLTACDPAYSVGLLGRVGPSHSNDKAPKTPYQKRGWLGRPIFKETNITDPTPLPSKLRKNILTCTLNQVYVVDGVYAYHTKGVFKIGNQCYAQDFYVLDYPVCPQTVEVEFDKNRNVIGVTYEAGSEGMDAKP